MKHLSVKVKLTILYTFFMVLATCAALAVLLSLSTREVLAGTQSRLERRVQESTENIRLEDGEMRLDSDFYSVTGDIYLSLYDEQMYFLYGKLPYGFNSSPECSDGQVRTIREDGREWFVYDLSFRLDADHTVYVRGITSITDAEESFSVTVRFALILFPAMTILMAVIGYRLTRRTLLPVRRMTGTVQQIRSDGDLSRRVGAGKSGGKKTRDEITILAETFDGMLQKMEEAFRRERQFTSDVSHELRTPVAVILAQCDACLADDSLSDEQKEKLELIRHKAAEMSDMISRLLFLSRADQGRQVLQKELLNVSELTQMVAEEEQALADTEGKPVRILCDVQPDVHAQVDETLYIRMLSNLLSNAVFYGKENGTVTVALRQQENRLTGTVADDGIGIAPEDLPKIWERFYRADPSRTEGNRSGLGLPMVRWIVQAHGGQITADSTPGEGSTFTFWLPVEKNEKNENF